jgi:hypothetical protein
VGAAATAGFGIALAGRLIGLSPTWRFLSYAIAIALGFAVVLRVLGFGDFADILVAIAAGIGVPIWAFLLARGTDNTPAPATS